MKQSHPAASVKSRLLRATLHAALSLTAILFLAMKFKLQPEDPGDFYTVWFGARAVLHGQDPYSDDVSQSIQLHNYGRHLSDYEIKHGRDQTRFAYPAYMSFILAPFTLFSYHTARALACGLFAIVIAASIPLWSRISGWRAPPPVMAWLVVIVLLSPVASRGLRIAQVGIFAGFLLCTAALAIAKDHLFTAGVILAAATSKPQLALLPTGWFVLWCFGKMEKRWRLLLGFLLTTLSLVGASLALVPHWIQHFFAGLRVYRHYTGAPSAFDAILGRRGSILPSLLVVVMFIYVAWRSRSAEASSRSYALALSLSLVATTWAIPANFDPYNQLLCLPFAFLLGRAMHDRASSRVIANDEVSTHAS